MSHKLVEAKKLGLTGRAADRFGHGGFQSQNAEGQVVGTPPSARRVFKKFETSKDRDKTTSFLSTSRKTRKIRNTVTHTVDFLSRNRQSTVRDELINRQKEILTSTAINAVNTSEIGKLQSLALNTSLTSNLVNERRTREEKRRAERERELKAASDNIRRVEALQQPLTKDEAQDILAPKATPTPVPLKLPEPSPLPSLKETVFGEEIPELTATKEEELVLKQLGITDNDPAYNSMLSRVREIKESDDIAYKPGSLFMQTRIGKNLLSPDEVASEVVRISDSVEVTDKQIRIDSVLALGSKIDRPSGKLSMAATTTNDNGEPIPETISGHVDTDGGLVPSRYLSGSSRQRYLEGMIANARIQFPDIHDEELNRVVAIFFDEQLDVFRDELSKTVTDETLIEPVLEMELRRIELQQDMLESWNASRTTSVSDFDKLPEDIKLSFNKSISDRLSVEFEEVTKAMEPKSEFERFAGFKPTRIEGGAFDFLVGGTRLAEASIRTALAITTGIVAIPPYIMTKAIETAVEPTGIDTTIPGLGVKASETTTFLPRNIAERSIFDFIDTEEERNRKLKMKEFIANFPIVGDVPGIPALAGVADETPILGSTLEDTLPDLLVGLEQFHRGGNRFLAEPLTEGFIEGVPFIIQGAETQAEYFGVKGARGTISEPVKKELKSKVSRAILEEAFNPANLILALPFAGQGLRAGMGAGEVAARVTANLLATGLEPGAAIGIKKLSMYMLRNGIRATLRNAPKKLTDLPIFARMMRNMGEYDGIRMGRPYILGTGAETILDDATNLWAIGGTHDVGGVRLRRLQDAAVEEKVVKSASEASSLSVNELLQRLSTKRQQALSDIEGAIDVSAVPDESLLRLAGDETAFDATSGKPFGTAKTRLRGIAEQTGDEGVFLKGEESSFNNAAELSRGYSFDIPVEKGVLNESRLTPVGEKLLLDADKSKSISRARLLAVAKAERVGYVKNLSDEQIVNLIRHKKKMITRLAEDFVDDLLEGVEDTGVKFSLDPGDVPTPNKRGKIPHVSDIRKTLKTKKEKLAIAEAVSRARKYNEFSLAQLRAEEARILKKRPKTNKAIADRNIELSAVRQSSKFKSTVQPSTVKITKLSKAGKRLATGKKLPKEVTPRMKEVAKEHGVEVTSKSTPKSVSEDLRKVGEKRKAAIPGKKKIKAEIPETSTAKPTEKPKKKPQNRTVKGRRLLNDIDKRGRKPGRKAIEAAARALRLRVTPGRGDSILINNIRRKLAEIDKVNIESVGLRQIKPMIDGSTITEINTVEGALERYSVDGVMRELIKIRDGRLSVTKLRDLVVDELNALGMTAGEVLKNPVAISNLGRTNTSGVPTAAKVAVKGATKGVKPGLVKAHEEIIEIVDGLVHGTLYETIGVGDELVNYEALGFFLPEDAGKLKMGRVRWTDPGDPGTIVRSSNSLEEFMRDHVRSMANALGGFARWAGNTPISGFFKGINRTAVMGDSLLQQVVSGAMNKEIMINSLSSQIQNYFEGKYRRLGFKFSDNIATNLKSTTGEAVTPEYLATFPENVYRIDKNGKRISDSFGNGLKPNQRDMIDEFNRWLKAQESAELDFLAKEKFGLLFTELKGANKEAVRKELNFSLGAGTEEGKFWHNEVIRAKSTEEKNAIFERLGKTADYTPGYQKDKVYATQLEGLNNGETYAAGLVNPVMARLKAGQMWMLEKEIAQQLTDKGDQVLLRQAMDSMRGQARNSAVRAMNAFNNISRPLVTGTDTGFLGLQVIPAAARNPVAALRGLAMTVDALVFDGRVYAKYIEKELKEGTLSEFFNNGGVFDQIEGVFDDAATSDIGKFAKNITERLRFHQAFSNAVNITGLETYKGMVGVNDFLFRALGNRRATQVITQAFGGFTDLEGDTSKQMAASVANKLTLRMNSQMLGIVRGQRVLETSMLFAPRYYRAFFGLFGDALQGGLRGAEARRSFGQLIFGFMALNTALEAATGKSFQLEPWKKNFMTIEVEGVHIGPGGPLVSLLSVIGKTAEHPENLTTFNIDKNPIIRWGRGKLSPVASFVTDTIKGEAYSGQPMKSPKDFVNALAVRRGLPFAVQAGIDAYDSDASPLGVGLSIGAELLTGARTYPLSPSEVRDGVRDEVARELYGVRGRIEHDPDVEKGGWKSANAVQRGKIYEETKMLEAEQTWEKEMGKAGFEWFQNREQERELLEEFAKTGRVEDLAGRDFVIPTTQEQDNKALLAGELNGLTYADNYRKRQSARAAIRTTIRSMQNREPFEGDNVDDPVNIAIDEYFEVLPENYISVDGDEEKGLEPGEIDWEEYFDDQDDAYINVIHVGGKDAGLYVRPPDEDELVQEFKDATKVKRQVMEMPKYKGLTVDQSTQVDTLIETATATSRILAEMGERVSKLDIVSTLLKLGDDLNPEFTKIASVAFLRLYAPTRELMWNEERHDLIMENPATVRYFISTYDALNEERKIRFRELFGDKYFTNIWLKEEKEDIMTPDAYKGLELISPP